MTLCWRVWFQGHSVQLNQSQGLFLYEILPDFSFQDQENYWKIFPHAHTSQLWNVG